MGIPTLTWSTPTNTTGNPGQVLYNNSYVYDSSGPNPAPGVPVDNYQKTTAYGVKNFKTLNSRLDKGHKSQFNYLIMTKFYIIKFKVTIFITIYTKIRKYINSIFEK